LPTLTLICEAGRNKHGQRLVILRCSCGSPDFACREDSFKQGRTKSCGCVRSVHKLKPVPASPEVAASVARFDASYDEIIAAKEAAALSAERRAHLLELRLEAEDSTNLDTHKAWKTESTTARQLRQEIARLKVAKDKTQTSLNNSELSYDEILRAKIASLKQQA
jgi:hypothetical protein